MALRHRMLRKMFPFYYLIFFSLLIILFITHGKNHPCPPHLSFSTVVLSPNAAEAERISTDQLWIWCPEMESYFHDDKATSDSPQLRAPSLDESRIHRLPYRYSNWKSPSLLPRRITLCEHQLMMRLLMIIVRVCHEHSLTLAMSDGTLLGSWRHHDVILWDDDLDSMMPIEHQLTLVQALEQFKDTVIQYYLIEYPLNNSSYPRLIIPTAATGQILAGNEENRSVPSCYASIGLLVVTSITRTIHDIQIRRIKSM